MIVPAILTKDKKEFIDMLNTCKEFTNYAQIDIMDGEFVPSRSITKEDLKDIKPDIETEAHLMVKNPTDWILAFKNFGSKRIIFHFEIKDPIKVIREIRSFNLNVGLAINPQTKIEEFLHLVDKVDSILFMSVNPGFYGSLFIPSVLDKIRDFKKIYPNKIIGIDGGIKLDNIGLLKDLGLDYICIGSAILKDKSPKEAYRKFIKLIG